MHSTDEEIDPELISYANDRGMFYAQLVEAAKLRKHDPHLALAEHDSILRPLLARADACLAYDLKEGSEALAAVADIASRERGRYRIDLSGDPVSGREYFWNASAGKRGSIAIMVPKNKYEPREIFSHCVGFGVMGNPSIAHTPSAFRFAQQRASAGEQIVFCLTKNNGFEWIDVFAKKGQAGTLFEEAFRMWRTFPR